MKFDELKSVAHNVSASLASGISFLIGIYDSEIFEEAAQAPDGFLEVDFLAGTIEGDSASSKLRGVVTAFRDKGLPDLCQKHGCTADAFSMLRTKYATDRVYGRYFIVTMADQTGRSSTDRYMGWDGKRG
ncbi:hypothetical protein [Ponticaulis profundi]|uniref:Uncharacterized protein n=1 Tax=Ponticaulis profundi TaxID=2665222 RepID=A0ABW1S9B0_9PROT